MEHFLNLYMFVTIKNNLNTIKALLTEVLLKEKLQCYIMVSMQQLVLFMKPFGSVLIYFWLVLFRKPFGSVLVRVPSTPPPFISSLIRRCIRWTLTTQSALVTLPEIAVNHVNRWCNKGLSCGKLSPIYCGNWTATAENTKCTICVT